MRTRSWMAVLTAAALVLAIALPVSAADPVRPFAGRSYGVDTMAAPTGCPETALSRDTIEAQGNFLHLGRVTWVTTHCSYLDMATLAGWFDQGEWTMTTANGDKLFLTEHGTFQLDTFPPTTSHASMSFEITGGTGRFVNASGSGDGHGVLDTATAAGDMWFSGWISY